MKGRRWDRWSSDDPVAGLINLFDLWIVVAVGFLIAGLGAARTASSFDANRPDARRLPTYRPTEDSLSGQGERLGVAYRLANGEVVYVPEAPRRPPNATPPQS